MNSISRFAAPVALYATLLGLVCCGCASSERRAALLSLPYTEFDQTYGSGFRILYDAGEYAEAAKLIEDYLKSRHELTTGQQKFLQLHAGQLFAIAGKAERAARHLDEALCRDKTPEPWPHWNDMLTATKAFLNHDRPALLAARQRLGADAKGTQLADNLLENFGGSYFDALLWHPLCQKVAIPKGASPAQRAEADKLVSTLGFSLTLLATNPPNGYIWLELRPFAPNPFPGYVVIHSRDGTLITASDLQWLNSGVKRLIKSSRWRRGHPEARIGLMTSFDVPLER